MSWLALTELISGRAVLCAKHRSGQIGSHTHFVGGIAAGKLGQMTAPSSTSRQLGFRLKQLMPVMMGKADDSVARSV